MLKNIFILSLAPLMFVACSSEKDLVEERPLQAEYKAEQTEDGPLARKEVTTVTAEATIKDLDLENRKLTLVGPEGRESTVTVSPQVKRLAEFKVGDKIRAQYTEALAFEVREPTDTEKANPRAYAASAAKTKEMLPPGIAAASLSHTIVEIEAIDLQAETVTIKTPENKSVTIKARVPDNLKRVKVGDTVAVTYAEAFAIGLEPLS